MAYAVQVQGDDGQSTGKVEALKAVFGEGKNLPKTSSPKPGTHESSSVPDAKKQEGSSEPALNKNAPVVNKIIKKDEKPVKEPSKNLDKRQRALFVENYVFDRKSPGMVNLDDESEINMQNSVQIINCKNATFLFKEGLKPLNVQLHNCENVQFQVDKVIAGVSLNKCKKIKVYYKGGKTTIQIDNSQGTSVFLMNEEAATSDIVMSACTEAHINVLEGDEWKELFVPFQFKFNYNKVSGELDCEPIKDE